MRVRDGSSVSRRSDVWERLRRGICFIRDESKLGGPSEVVLDQVHSDSVIVVADKSLVGIGTVERKRCNVLRGSDDADVHGMSVGAIQLGGGLGRGEGWRR